MWYIVHAQWVYVWAYENTDNKFETIEIILSLLGFVASMLQFIASICLLAFYLRYRMHRNNINKM